MISIQDAEKIIRTKNGIIREDDIRLKPLKIL